MREEGASELFKSFGVLGSFGAKIEVAYALRLCGRDVERELNI